MISDLVVSEKPRERLIMYGSESLSNEELLAIIIRTGSKSVSCKNVAALILKEFGCVENLKNASLNKLMNVKGMGQVKSVSILASLELGKRVYNSIDEEYVCFKNSKDYYNYFKNKFIAVKQECFYGIYLDSKLNMISSKLLFKGTVNSSTVHPREIFKNAFLESAYGLSILHNHPSGNVLPSTNDIEITRIVSEISELMGFKFIDHIIIGKNNYYSFYEEANKNK